MKKSTNGKRRQNAAAKKEQTKTSCSKASKHAHKTNKRTDKTNRKEKINRWFESNSALSYQSSCALDDLKNRKRWKTLNEREVLEWYYELDPEWTRKTINYIKDLVQLSIKQIYKWGYEKRRRLNGFKKDDKLLNLKHVTNISNLNSFCCLDNFNSIVDQMFPEDENQDEILNKEQMDIYDKVRDQLIERSEKYEQQSDLDKLLNERIPIQTIAVEAKQSQDDTPTDVIELEISTLNQNNSDKIKCMPLKFGMECNQISSQIKNSDIMKETIQINIEEEIVNILRDLDSNSWKQFGSDSDETQLKDSNNQTTDRPSSKSFENRTVLKDFNFRSNIDSFFIINDDPFRNSDVFLKEFSAKSILQNIPIEDLLNNKEDAIKYESLNDHCCSLISFSNELDYDQN